MAIVLIYPETNLIFNELVICKDKDRLYHYLKNQHLSLNVDRFECKACAQRVSLYLSFYFLGLKICQLNRRGDEIRYELISIMRPRQFF